MEKYAETRHEWVQGVVLHMSPTSITHDALVSYLRKLLEAYFDLSPIGKVVGEPFVMRLETTDSFREPDLQIILNDNPGKLTDTAMIGPADICIEVVSPESASRDYGDKFVEYEKAGVREYWIIDPVRQRCQFNRLDASSIYAPVSPDEASTYRTPLLPKLTLHVPTLWHEELPGFFAIGEAVRAMFGQAANG
jgi:Uma2 family endonuclease